jgi:hypothetical protein
MVTATCLLWLLIISGTYIQLMPLCPFSIGQYPLSDTHVHMHAFWELTLLSASDSHAIL